MLTLAFIGDVMLGRYVNELLKGITPAEMWTSCCRIWCRATCGSSISNAP